MKTSFAIAATAAVGLSIAQPALGQSNDEKLGTVHFETSCTSDAQKLFDRGMLYQHSFWYRASQRVFEDVLKADPECGIAYWGIALSLLWNPHSPAPAKNLAEGAAVLAKARPPAPRPSASATTSMRSAPCTPTTKKSITVRACKLTPRPWNNWHSAIPTMTKRR